MARFFNSVFVAFGVVFVMALLAGLAAPVAGYAAGKSGEAMILPVDPAALIVETAAGEQRFTIEIAADDRQRAAGLMFRTEMDDDHGMLFVFEKSRHLSFWMQNTPMPLDLVFIGADGRIVGILNGEPYSIAPIGPGVPAQFVLELKAGTAEKVGIANGDYVRHPRIDQVAGAK